MDTKELSGTATDRLLEMLGIKVDAAKDVRIVRSSETKKIIIPQEMKLKDVADWALKMDKEDERVVQVRFEFDCFPLDGAVAFRNALDTVYGFVQGATIPGNWFMPAQPPIMIGVPIGPGEVRQVPWGRVTIPGVEGWLQTGLDVTATPKFVLLGEIKQRHRDEIDRIASELRENLRSRSIYKGKAVRIDLSWMATPQGRQNFSPTVHAPQFTIPVDKVNEGELIFPADVQNDIELGLFEPIEHSEFCRQSQIPLKRGVMLAGEPGVGKSLTAYVTAKKAVQNGWTFIYLSRAADLKYGFAMAAQYQPAVLFVEDLDRVVSGEDRTEEIDAVLNAFDGVESKAAEVITVLTTNNLDAIPPVALRQGRCDTLVKVTRPDAEAAAGLVQLYGRGLMHPATDYRVIGEALAGHIPAEIREAVERAKLATIRRLCRTGGMPATGIKGFVTEMDVLDAVKAMEAQHRLLEPKKKDTRGVVEKMADILGHRIADAIKAGGTGPAVAAGFLQSLGIDTDKLYRATGELSCLNDLVGANGSH